MPNTPQTPPRKGQVRALSYDIMNNPHYLTERPHLLLGIILVVITLILLALAAARVWSPDGPFDDYVPNLIADPAETKETNETQ